VLLAAAWTAQAQDVSGAGFYPARGTARTIGMAGAFTAVADDAGGMHWNPAGMAQMKKRQGEVTTKVSDGGSYLHVAYVAPVADQTFGGGFSYLHASDGAGRSDNQIQYTYGQFFREEMAFGGSVRYHQAKNTVAKKANFGFDLGFLWRPKAYKRWALGAAVLDVNEPSFKGIGLSKRVINTGVAYRPDKFTVFDLDWYDVGSFAKKSQVRFGAERLVTQNIGVRAGVAQDTFGIGLSLLYKYVTLDYGFQRLDAAPDLNFVSLTANF
jgi:hypothetical protein